MPRTLQPIFIPCVSVFCPATSHDERTQDKRGLRVNSKEHLSGLSLTARSYTTILIPRHLSYSTILVLLNPGCELIKFAMQAICQYALICSFVVRLSQSSNYVTLVRFYTHSSRRCRKGYCMNLIMQLMASFRRNLKIVQVECGKRPKYYVHYSARNDFVDHPRIAQDEASAFRRYETTS